MRSGVTKQKSKDKHFVIVRLKRAGERFELRVLRDKLSAVTPAAIAESKGHVNWDDVLETQAVFSNAAKSEIAKPADVAKAFPNEVVEKVYAAILSHGEVLQSEEDRQASAHSGVAAVESLASIVASRCSIRPAKPGARAERLTTEIVERELKNARFKPPVNASPEEAFARAVRAVFDEGTIGIVRNSLVGVITSKKPADVPAQLTSLAGPYGFRIVSQAAEDTRVVIDAGILQAVKEFKGWTVEGSFTPLVSPAAEENLVLLVDNGVTGAAAAAAGSSSTSKPAAAAPKAKKAPSAKHDEDDDDDTSRPAKATGAKSLEDELAALKAADSDDDNRKGKGKKSGAAKAPASAAGGKQPAAKPAAKPSKAAAAEEEDDDDVVSSRNRRGKKGAKAAVAKHDASDDENDEDEE